METFFAALLPKLEHLGWWSYWIIFFASFMESLPFIGSFIPGTTIVAFSGFFASQGFLDFADLLWFVGIGAFLGDFIAYKCAKKSISSVFVEKLTLKKYIAHAKNFLEKYGWASIFVAKFVSHIRGIVAFLLGFTGMKTGRFIIFSLASSFLWSVAILSLGYFFGAIIGVVVGWMTRFSFFILILLVSIGLAFSLYKLWLKHGQGILFLKQTVADVLKTYYLELAARADNSILYKMFYLLRRRLTIYRFSGLPLTLLASGGGLSLLAIKFSDFWFLRDEMRISDARIASFLFEARDPSLTLIFKGITLFGSATFLSVIIVIGIFFFSSRKKIAETLAIAISFLFGTISLIIVKHSIARERPSVFLPLIHEDSFSFPSGHVLLSIIVYGIIAYFIAQNLPRWHTKVLISFSFGYGIFLIGLSRLYLGVHYFSDVIAGIFFGIFWLVFGIVLFEWLKRKQKSR